MTRLRVTAIMNPVEPITVRRDRWELLKPFLGALAFTAGSLWLATTDDILNKVIGGLGLVFFGLGTILCAWTFMYTTELEMDDEGYIDRTAFASPGRVRWSEIRAVWIEASGPHRCLVLAPADPAELYRRAGERSRMIVFRNEASFHHLRISDYHLPIPLETVIDTIQRHRPDLEVLPGPGTHAAGEPA